MTESTAVIEARLLVNALKPKYPLDVLWLANQILDKPVVLDQQYFPNNICAMILDKPEYTQVHIAVNLNRTYTSRRFGVVHELAHLYLGHQGDISFIDEEEDPVFHAEADEFSTEMLVPKHNLLTLAQKYNEPLALIHKILHGYNVSLEMTCRRLLELEIYNGTFSCFNENNTFFTYTTSGFELNTQQINHIPKIDRGCLVTSRETIKGVPVTFYIKRFVSGNFFAALVEEKPKPFVEKRPIYVLRA